MASHRSGAGSFETALSSLESAVARPSPRLGGSQSCPIGLINISAVVYTRKWLCRFAASVLNRTGAAGERRIGGRAGGGRCDGCASAGHPGRRPRHPERPPARRGVLPSAPRASQSCCCVQIACSPYFPGTQRTDFCDLHLFLLSSPPPQEDALVRLLVTAPGAPPPVRRAAADCLLALFRGGNAIAAFARIRQSSPHNEKTQAGRANPLRAAPVRPASYPQPVSPRCAEPRCAALALPAPPAATCPRR